MSAKTWTRGLAGMLLGTLLSTTGGASAPGENPFSLESIRSEPSAGLLKSGLLDLSRFDIRHSLSYSFASTGGLGSRSGGLWLTEIGYEISRPLRISMDVGATLDPGGDGPLLSEKSFFLHRLDLDYRPSKHFMLNISYVNLPETAATALGYRRLGGGIRPWNAPLGLDR